MNIPAHLVSINQLSPELLSEEALNHIVFADWYRLNQAGVGELICIDAEAIPVDLMELSNLPYPEDIGFNLTHSDVYPIHGYDKRWNDSKFYV